MTSALRLALSAFALAALLLPSSAVGQSADGSRELSLQLQPPVAPFEAVPTLDCNVDSGDIVAWDLSNGATTGDHTLLISDLVAAGFTIRTINIAVDSIPPCLHHLVITTQAFNACLTSVYPAPLVDLVRNSVRAGLGLFLLNEWGVSCGQGSAPIANALGAAWNGNFGASQTFFAGTDFDPNNPATLFQGVSSWQQFAGSDYTASVNVVVRTNANLPAMIAGRVERGCVVIAGDSNWIANNWIGF